MIRLLFLFLCICGFTKMTNAQEVKLIWIYNGEIAYEYNIKDILNNLPNLNNVEYLNDLESFLEDEYQIRNLIEDLSSGDVRVNSDNRDKVNNEVVDLFIDANYCLKVNAEQVQGKVLISFYLHNTVPGYTKDETTYFPIISKKPKSKSEAEIESGDSSEIRKHKLENAIKKLFEDSGLNKPPVLKMKVNNKEYKSSKVYHLYGTDLLLDASESDDPDTHADFFDFKWRQININGDVNVEKSKRVVLSQIEKNLISLPDTGMYYFGVKVSDGIEESKEKIIVVDCIYRPKVWLATKEYRRKSKISIFQWLFHKDSLKLTNYQLAGAFESPLDLEPSIKLIESKVIGLRKRELCPNLIYSENNHFIYQFQGKLRRSLVRNDYYKFQISGLGEHIPSDTTTFIFQRPKLEFYRVTFGTNYFVGFQEFGILGVNKNKFWMFSPFEAKGGIYLGHWDYPDASIIFESGVLLVLTNAQRETFAEGLGIMSLKFTANDAFLSFNLIAGGFQDTMGNLEYRQNWGISLGYKHKNILEIDLLNVYHEFGTGVVSLAGGIRYNIFSLIK